MRGVNDDEVVDFARLTLDHPWHVRFIELMPVGSLEPMTEEMVVPSEEVLSRIQDALGPLARTKGQRAATDQLPTISSTGAGEHRRHHADDTHVLR